jgi:hypothetical protein
VDVDNIIIANNNLSVSMDIENILAQAFEMTLLGDVHLFLGNQIIKNCVKACIFLFQSKYLKTNEVI